ncbi:hypothetical protein AB0D57_07100 [Streptomyces sp. NPDC048275]|uniref:hypothetical protein n=1 Tax=Streptomyces sp. NPDC048275 TaxID=3155629 RepID=UPI0033C57EE2
MLRRISARYFRGFGAAVVAVAALVLAANAVPARAEQPTVPNVQQATSTSGTTSE